MSAQKALRVETPSTDGGANQIVLAEAAGLRAAALVEAHDRYFDLTRPWFAIPLAQLRHTRVRVDGVERAIGYMEDAAAGRIPVRDTIKVQALADGLFAVLDGNSTVAVARVAGWSDLPCHWSCGRRGAQGADPENPVDH